MLLAAGWCWLAAHAAASRQGAAEMRLAHAPGCHLTRHASRAAFLADCRPLGPKLNFTMESHRTCACLRLCPFAKRPGWCTGRSFAGCRRLLCDWCSAACSGMSLLPHMAPAAPPAPAPLHPHLLPCRLPPAASTSQHLSQVRGPARAAAAAPGWRQQRRPQPAGSFFGDSAAGGGAAPVGSCSRRQAGSRQRPRFQQHQRQAEAWR